MAKVAPEAKYQKLMSVMDKRPYQEAIIRKVAENPDKNFIVHMDTGLGKTLIGYGAFYLRQELGNLPPDAKGLMLVDSRAVRDQSARDVPKKFRGMLGDYFFRNDPDWEQYRRIGGKLRKQGEADSRARDVYGRELKEATWIVSTPLQFASHNPNGGNLKYIEEAGVASQIRYVVIDEAQRFLAIHNPKRQNFLQEDDIGLGWSPTYDYAPTLYSFIRKHNPQVISLAATFDSADANFMLEQVLNAKTIAPKYEDIAEWKPELRRHVVNVVDGEVAEMAKILARIRDRSIYTIAHTHAGMNKDNPEMYRMLYVISSLRFREGAPNSAQFTGVHAATAITCDVLLRGLYGNVYMRDFKDQLEKAHRRMPWLKEDRKTFEKSYQDWIELEHLMDMRLSQSEYAAKTPKTIAILQSEDIRNSEFEIQFDERGPKHKNVKEKRSLLFTRLRPTARTMSNILQREGINSKFVTGTDFDPEAQYQILRGFKDGDIQVLISTDRYLGLGMDLPQADVVIDHDYDANPANAYQRASRIRGGDQYALAYENTSETRRISGAIETWRQLALRTEKVPIEVNPNDDIVALLEDLDRAGGNVED